MTSKLTLASTVLLNDGITIPIFGLGMWQMANDQSGINAVRFALQNGYRLIDTATLYNNENETGIAMRESGIARKDIFVVTKLYTNDHGYNECKKAFAESLKKLNCDYVDLYLIHSPRGGKLLESYDAMLELKKDGLIRSVGVSNFGVHHLEQLKKLGRPAPSVNQIELHTFLKQQDIVDYCRANNIALMAYCPIARGCGANDQLLLDLAKKHGKTVAQVMIRWCLDQGFITIPKSVNENRIIENTQVFDFQLTDEDKAAIEKLPEIRCSWNPTTDPWE